MKAYRFVIWCTEKSITRGGSECEYEVIHHVREYSAESYTEKRASEHFMRNNKSAAEAATNGRVMIEYVDNAPEFARDESWKKEAKQIWPKVAAKKVEPATLSESSRHYYGSAAFS